jgi:SAM-dependent methyltransferase
VLKVSSQSETLPASGNPPAKRSTTKGDNRAALQEIIERSLGSVATPHILEAGCGSVTNIKFPGESHITGIDISRRELEANRILSERVVGDLQTYEFPADTFDLIVCWDVLEHLPLPEKALEHFTVALKPGGLLLIKVPNRDSVKATAVRFTPYWFHRMVYKMLYGRRFGSPGVIPFPTFFRASMGRRGLMEFATRKGLGVECFHMYESKIQYRFRNKVGIGDRLMTSFEWLVRIFTLGKLSLIQSECTYLYRKSLDPVLAGDNALS